MATRNLERFTPPTEDTFVVHSGLNGIGDAVSLQIISKEVSSAGKHPASVIDFGHKFGSMSGLYGGFGLPPQHEGTFGLILYDIFPSSLHNLARDDFPKPRFNEIRTKLRGSDNGQKLEIDFVKKAGFQNNEVDSKCVVITHEQSDHNGNLGAVRTDIPIIASEETQLLSESVQKGSKKHWYNERVNFSEGKSLQPRPYINIENGGSYCLEGIDGYNIKLFPTDHWFGSVAVETELPSGKRIFYTGDLNAGSKTEKMFDYLKTQKPYDLFILDATHVGNDFNSFSEKELENEFTERFRNKGPFYVAINERDLNRLNTVVNAAKRTQMDVYVPLAIAKHLAYLKNNLAKSGEFVGLDDITVYLQPNESGRYSGSDLSKYKDVFENESVEWVPQNELNAKKEKMKAGVVITTTSSQLRSLDVHGLLGKKKDKRRLILSSYGFNPTNPSGRAKWSQLNPILNSAGMTTESLNGHHLNEERFRDFIENYMRAEMVILLHATNNTWIKNFVEESYPGKTNVLTSLKHGEPYFFDGTSLPTETVIYQR